MIKTTPNKKPEPFYIGKVKIYPPLILAPLAEITDIHLRPLLKKLGGLGLVVSEMVSSEGLTRQNRRSYEALKIEDSEHPIAIQIYGNDPVRMAQSAREAAHQGADIIDINFGCPARKIIKNGKGGVALMKDLDLSRRIVNSVCSAVDLPVTVKFRLGWDAKNTNFLEFGTMALQEGASALTLHARTKNDGFRGTVNRDAWKALAEISPVPVIANGDIKNTEDVKYALENCCCSGAMIGRPAMRNPFIFREIWGELTADGFNPSWKDYETFFVSYYESVKKNGNSKYILHKIRTMAGWLSHFSKNGSGFRRRINSFKDEDELFNEFISFFNFHSESPGRMTG